MVKFEIKGIEELEANQKEDVQKLVDKYIEKIGWSISNDFYLRLAIKVYSKDKENKVKRKRYSLTAELSGEIPKILAGSEEWDLNKAVNRVFEKLLLEIEHKFHVSDKH
jgi:hypothetical protein